MRNVVLITGASKGIGASIAIEFAKKNYDVVINYFNSLDDAKKVETECQKYNVNTLLVKADISNEEDIDNMIVSIINKFGKIDILVNNAAISLDNMFKYKTKEEFNKVLNTNLVGPFLLSQKVSKYMLENKFGKIINIASTNGIDTYYPESIDYDASKAGIISLTHNLSKELAPYINVNAVAPGWVNTDMNKELDNEFKKSEINKINLKRFAEPKEIAKVVVFLASDEASYINSEIIRVDGGY